MADKNIVMHPIVNGEEDASVNLYPETTKENIVDFSVESGDVNSGSASAGQVLVADGSGGASFETLDIRTYREFPSAWLPYTQGTTAAFCAAVNSDATAVGGMAYLGELRCSDLPSPLVNVEAIVEIINDTNLQKKVIHITISSGNSAPYRWEYTYWNNKTIKGWIGFQPALTAGDNITINANTNTISAVVPAQVQSNWSEADTDSAAYIQNKPTLGTSAAKDYTTSVTDGSADLVTSGAVYTAIDELPEPMVFKGSVGTSGTVEWANLPAASSANVGYTYKVITAHDTTPICSVGDTIISSGSEWVVIPSGDEPSGTVTSVNISVPNELEVSGGPVTSSGTIAITYAEGYSIPSTTDQQAWSAKQNAIDSIDANGLYIDPEDYDGTSALQYTYSSTGGIHTAAVTTGSYTELTEIKVPKYVKYNNIWHEVTEIGAGVFNGCAALESITIPFIGGNKNATVASASTLFGYIFGTDSYTGGTSTKQDYASGTSYAPGPSATYYIPTSLRSVTVTGGNILYGAFYNCNGLTSVTIPDSVTSIGDSAFNHCTGLTSVAPLGVPPSVGALVLPDSVTYVGKYAFEDCGDITSIVIPKDLDVVGYDTFDATRLTNIYYYGDLSQWCSKSELGGVMFPYTDITETTPKPIHLYIKGIEVTGHLHIPADVRSIGPSAFCGCAIRSVVIGSNLVSIGKYAFSDCNVLTTVTFGNGVTSIGEGAFYNCSGLTSISIPDSVTSIGSYAFENCSGLTSISIPDSVTAIREQAFSGCSSLVSVTIGSSVISIGDYAFSVCASLATITFNQEIVHEISGAPWGAPNNPTITYNGLKSEAAVSSGTTNSLVTTGEKYVWDHKSDLTVDLVYDGLYHPSSTAGLVFGNYSTPAYTCDVVGYTGSDVSVVIPDVVIYNGNAYTVSRIANTAFANNTDITAIVIPEHVTAIDAGAFSGCSALVNMTIPFVGGVAGKTNTDNEQYPLGYIFGTDSYDGGSAIAQQYYYDHSGFLPWPSTTTYYIPASLRSVTVTGGNILFGAFYGCSMLTSITLHNDPLEIGGCAFKLCSGLTSFVVPNSVTVIDIMAFENCTNLASVVIGDHVEKIGDSAFFGCLPMTTISLPDSVTKIGTGVFGGIGDGGQHVSSIIFNQKIVHEVSGAPWGASYSYGSSATITYNGRLSPSIITVTDITALTSYQLNSLECGYIVNQKSSGVSRSYVVSYKDTTLGELSLVYTDHTGLQEVHYNTVSDNWAYDQTYSVSFGS